MAVYFKGKINGDSKFIIRSLSPAESADFPPGMVQNARVSNTTEHQTDFLFTLDRLAEYYEISIDGGPWQPYAGQTIAGFLAGTTHSLNVRGVNHRGAGPALTVPVSFVMLPDVPKNLMISNVTSSAFTLAFDPVVSATNYQYSFNSGTTWGDFTTGPITLSGLTPLTNYSVVLRAFNASGAGQPSAPATTTTLSAKPAAVTNLSGTPTETGFYVSFTAAPTATSYEFSRDGQTWTVIHNGDLITGLNPKTQYSFYVRGVNDAGFGPAAAATVTTLTPIPATITDLSYATLGDTFVTLKFTLDPYTTSYSYSLNNGPYLSLANDYTVRGLTALTAYTVKVIGNNSRGQSAAPSNTLSFTTTKPLPGAPNFAEITHVYPYGADIIVTNYDTPSNGGANYFEYTVDNGATWKRLVAATSTDRQNDALAEGLAPNTTYSMAVRGVNEAGGGAASAYRTFTTYPQTTGMDPIKTSSKVGLSNGNLSVGPNIVNGWGSATSLIGYKPGTAMVYAEMFIQNITNTRIAIVPEDYDFNNAAEGTGIIDVYPAGQQVISNGSAVSSSANVGNWIRVAWNGQAAWFGSSLLNSWGNNGNPGSNINGYSTSYFNPNKKYYLAVSSYNTAGAGGTVYVNFGDSPFRGSLPTGFTAWKGA